MDEYTNAWEGTGAPVHLYGELRSTEKRSLRRQSNRVGLCLVALLVVEWLLSQILFSSETLYGLYMQNDTVFELVEMFYYVLCMLVPFLIAYLSMSSEEKDTLTLFQPPASKITAVTAVVSGFLVCNAANYLTNVMLSMLEDAGVTVSGGTYDTPQTAVQLVYSVLTIAILPAFVEEFALRGVVMQPLRRHGDLFAILMSAFVFALMHGNLSQFAFAFLVGTSIGYFVVAAGSVWVGVAIHLLNNLYSVVLNYLLDVRPTAADTLYRIELSVTLVLGIIGFALFFTVCRRNRLQKPNGVLTAGEKTAAYIFTVPMIGAIILLVVKTVSLISFGGN